MFNISSLNKKRYSSPLIYIHWIMSFMIISMIFTGYLMEFIELSFDYKKYLYSYHQQLGVLVLILLIVRIIMKLASPKVHVPSKDDKVQYRSYINNYFLYFLMAFSTISGYAMTSTSIPDYRNIQTIFGYQVPMLFPSAPIANEVFDVLHFIAGILISLSLGYHLIKKFNKSFT